MEPVPHHVQARHDPAGSQRQAGQRGDQRGGDEGEYAWGADILARGGVPYRDNFLQKPPGIVLIYWATFQLAGTGFVPIHAAAALALGCTAYLLYRIGLTVGGPGAGWLSGTLFLLAMLDRVDEVTAANGVLFMVLPVAGAALLLR